MGNLSRQEVRDFLLSIGMRDSHGISVESNWHFIKSMIIESLHNPNYRLKSNFDFREEIIDMVIRDEI